MAMVELHRTPGAHKQGTGDKAEGHRDDHCDNGAELLNNSAVLQPNKHSVSGRSDKRK
jgi:hypothetical protein